MTPPRVAARLLERALPRGPEGDTIRGDLLEEYGRRRGRSALTARLWYWRAALSLVFSYRSSQAERDARSAQHPLDAVLQDLRYGVRTLLKAPAFSLVVLVILALGIGANTAIFSALNAVLLRPLPYPDPDRLVRLVGYNPPKGLSNSALSAADFMDWRRDAQAFQELAAFVQYSITIRGEAGAERVGTAEEFNLFRVLGVSPNLGRDFVTTDERSGAPSAVIVSSGLWRRRWGGTDVIGKPFGPGRPAAVVGVFPSGAAYPENVDLWFPAILDAAADRRNNRMYEVIGRLKPGVTLQQAQAELDAICVRLDEAFPATNRGWRVHVVPLLDFIVGSSRRTLVALLGAVGLVLLVVCANVASLFIAHGAARQREIAVRTAIGAARGRIVRQMLTESVLLSTIAGVLGVAIGHWLLRLLIAIAAGGVPRLDAATLDRPVLLFALAVSVGTGIVFGLLPALRLSRPDLGHALRERTAGAGSRGRTGPVLVAAEVAMAVVLLVAAGLLARSFRSLQQVDVGFQPANLLTMRVTLSGPKYREPGSDARFFEEAVRRIEALPGMRSAAAVLSLPVGGGGFYLGRGFIRPGRPHPDTGYDAMYQIVTPRYFATLGMPLISGRDFDAHDTAASTPVVVINRTIAERYFPGENPIGQQLFVWIDEQRPRQIVGVVGDLKSKDLTAAADPQLYVPHAQSSSSDLTLVVRTEGPPGEAAPAVRSVLKAIDPGQAPYDARTMDSVMGDALAEQRFSVVLFAGFALLALVLVAIGLYGVMAQAVAARTREMGVRIALGARPSAVRRLVVMQGAALLGAGLAVGLPAALVSARLLGTLLYGVSPSDPLTTAAVVSAIAAVTILAAYVPARRATRVDPAVVLRGD